MVNSATFPLDELFLLGIREKRFITMRKSAVSILLSAAIGFTLTLQPVTCSAAAVIILNAQRQQRENDARAAELARQNAADAAARREALATYSSGSADTAVPEELKPHQNVILDVRVQSGHNTMSSEGPVASGSPLHLRLTDDREYISSKTYSSGNLTGVAKFNAVLGDDIVIVPNITRYGNVEVEVSVSHGTPSKDSDSPWINREFVTEKKKQTFLLMNGGEVVTRTVEIPGVDGGITFSLRATVQAD